LEAEARARRIDFDNEGMDDKNSEKCSNFKRLTLPSQGSVHGAPIEDQARHVSAQPPKQLKKQRTKLQSEQCGVAQAERF
jgi:hypothetical protein